MRPGPLALTLGDPAGVGPEIVVKALGEGDQPFCVVLGRPEVIRAAADRFQLAA